MGIDDRRIYARVMAIAFATWRWPACSSASARRSGPPRGPPCCCSGSRRWSSAGLGSLWGTLVGGIVLGVAQTLGNQVDVRYDLLSGVLYGHLVFLAVLAFRPQGLFGGAADERDRGASHQPATPESTAGLARVRRAGRSPWPRCRLWDPERTLQPPLVIVLIYLSLAQMWNLLAGFAGLISIGQQMFVGIGVYSLLTLAEDRGSTPTCLGGAGRAGRRRAVDPGGAVRLPAEGRLLRHRHLGDRRGGPPAGARERLAGRRRRAQPHPLSLGGYSRDARDDITYWLALALAVGATAIVVLVLRSPARPRRCGRCATARTAPGASAST